MNDKQKEQIYQTIVRNSQAVENRNRESDNHTDGYIEKLSWPDFWQDMDVLFEAAIVQAQTNAVAWTVGIIDQLHIDDGNWKTDSEYKGIKNTIRDRYKAEIGIDPAPNYPINVQLNQSLNSSKGDTDAN